MAANLTGILEFVTVAEAGGFSAAARALGSSKSHVSVRVAELEARLGARLFSRSTRRLSLTEAGQVYLEHCRQILEELARGGAAVQELQTEPRGRLRVATTPNIARLHIVPMLEAFWARHPHVSVDLLADERVVDLVAAGVDLAIRFTALDNPSLIVRRLAPVRFILCASPDYLSRYGTPIHPNDLRQHVRLSYGFEPTWNEWRFQDRDGGTIRMPTSGLYRTDNGVLVTEAALAGCGIALQTDVTAGRYLKSGQLVQLLPDWPLGGIGDSRFLCAGYPANRAIPMKVRAFVTCLIDHIGDPPSWAP